MNESFLRLFDALQTAIPDITPSTLANALWLCQHQAAEVQRQTQIPTSEAQEEQPSFPPATAIENRAQPNKRPQPEPHGKEPPHNAPQDQPSSPELRDSVVPLYTENNDTTGSPRIRTPSAPALPQRSRLLKAMRSMRRKRPSEEHYELDEQATASRVAEERIFSPVFKPVQERSLNASVVFENNKEMGPWHQLAREVQELLIQLGAFRDVCLWTLNTTSTPSGDNQLRVSPGSINSQGPSLSCQHLNATRQQRLLVLMTDCTSPIWQDGSIVEQLSDWKRFGPVAILQVLPEHMWRRSVLRHALPMRLRASVTPHSLTQWRVMPLRPYPRGQALDEHLATHPMFPVLKLEEECLRSFAGLITGASWGSALGYALPRNYNQQMQEARQQLPATSLRQTSISPEERLSRFWGTASEGAKELARYLSAAPATNIPIMRLIRQSMLPEGTHLHEAEILLGGILQVQQDDPHPEKVLYDFQPGIREQLLDSMTQYRSMQVLKSISSYIEKHFGQMKGFAAALSKPAKEFDDIDLLDMADENRPFALIAREVLLRQGGRYAELLHQSGPITPPGVGHWRGGNLRNRQLIGIDLKHVDLRKTDFRGAQLDKADLSHTDLRGALFQEASVEGTKFHHARFNSRTIWPAEFESSNIGAFGPGTFFSEQEFTNMDLMGYSLQDSQFHGCSFKESDLSYTYLVRGIFTGSTFEHANLVKTQADNADFSHTQMRMGILHNARLTDATFYQADLALTSFKDADCAHVDLTAASLINADFTNADLSYAYFTGAFLQGANFSGAMLQGADFSGANLSAAIFNGANITAAVIDADATHQSEWDVQQILWWLTNGGELESPSEEVAPTLTPMVDIYIPRPIEEEILQELRHPGALAQLQAPPNFGKTTCLRNILSTAQERIGCAGFHVIGNHHPRLELNSVSTILKKACYGLGQLSGNTKVAAALEAVPRFDKAPFTNAKTLLEKLILPALEQPVILVFDALDGQFTKTPDEENEFVGTLRDWSELGQRDIAVKDWGKLRFLLASTEPIHFKGNHTSNFQLPPFSQDELHHIADAFDIELSSYESTQLISWFGGHPAMCIKTIEHASIEREERINQLLAILEQKPVGLINFPKLFAPENATWKPLLEELARHLVEQGSLFQQSPLLFREMERLSKAQQPERQSSRMRLIAHGMAKEDERGQLHWLCDLYKRHFQDQFRSY